MKCFVISLVTFLLLAFSTSAQESLIQNGDFSDTTSTDWEFSGGATGGIENGKYIISITSPGNNEWDPQLLQSGLALTKGEAYKLSFDAWAQDTGFIRVFLSGSGIRSFLPYSDSILGKVELTPTRKTFTISFIMEENTDTDARLQFNCGLSSNLTTIGIDDVSLVLSTDPIIRVVSPISGERWITGEEKKISWTNSGTLSHLKIQFSNDFGSTWQVIAASVQNSISKEYWWTVPENAVGEQCLIILSDTAGTIADTSDVFRILQQGTVVEGEMVLNGDFLLDTAHWQFSSYAPARATGEVVSGEYVISIDTIGSNNYEVKLAQLGLKLIAGMSYQFSFDAYASSPREIYANIGRINGGPWSLSGADTIPILLTTDKQKITSTFTVDRDYNDIRIEFNCGSDTPTVFIDNVSLIETVAPVFFITQPASGTVWKSATEQSIIWAASEITPVTLEYSDDNGETWQSVAEGIENMGEYNWGVPDISSELCIIRIIETETDSVLGQSAVFQINSFGTVVSTGELIVNGSFSQLLHGWDFTQANDAQATTSTVDEILGISIAEPGSSLEDIILSQSGLTLLGGKEYVLSFSSFATGNRSMAIKIYADDSTLFLDTTISLPSSMESDTIIFTPDIDALAKIEFHVGGSRAGIYIDEVSLRTSESLPVRFTKAARRVKQQLQIVANGKGIIFTTGKAVNGRILIYNLNGTMVRSLQISGERIVWDRTDSRGSSVARGTYIAALKTANSSSVSRFLVK